MADFALLYSGGRTPQTEDEQAKFMKAWTDWYDTIGARLKDGGNPSVTPRRSRATAR